jgi:hypothetical protein
MKARLRHLATSSVHAFSEALGSGRARPASPSEPANFPAGHGAASFGSPDVMTRWLGAAAPSFCLPVCCTQAGTALSSLITAGWRRNPSGMRACGPTLRPVCRRSFRRRPQSGCLAGSLSMTWTVCLFPSAPSPVGERISRTPFWAELPGLQDRLQLGAAAPARYPVHGEEGMSSQPRGLLGYNPTVHNTVVHANYDNTHSLSPTERQKPKQSIAQISEHNL